jgi:hypothetical protein
MKEKKHIDTMTVDELKEYIFFLWNELDEIERSKEYYERIAKALSKS